MSAVDPVRMRRAIADYVERSARAVELQRTRALSAKGPLDVEVEFALFTVALRSVARAVDRAVGFTDGEADRERSKPLHAARDEFYATVAAYEVGPASQHGRDKHPLVKIRDAFEHFDDYDRGKGEHFRDPLFPVWFATNETTVEGHVASRYVLDVAKSADAALEAARKTHAVLTA